MLPRAQRLTDAKDIRDVFRTGAKRGNGLVVCYARKSDRPRAAVVVSNAVGNAPTRNRVKRRLRHALAMTLPQQSVDLVVRALPASAHASWNELASATTDSVTRAVADA